MPPPPAQRWGKPHLLHPPSFPPGEKAKSKEVNARLDCPRSKQGRALPKAGALLTPAPEVRSLVSRQGLCPCSYFVIREDKNHLPVLPLRVPTEAGQNWVSWAPPSWKTHARGWMSAPIAPLGSEPVVPVPHVGVPWSLPAA